MSHPTSTGGRILAALAGLALVAGLQAPGLVAQEQVPPQEQPAPQPQQQEAPDIEISDGEMEQFAQAYLEVEEIQLELNEELQAAQMPEEAQQIQQEANQEMETAITEEGMDVERFSLIVQAINADPELQEEFAATRMELTGEEPPAQQGQP
ncbi:MAG: DUF4168 domain-containing protein [Gemmatimonadota bacterium]